MAVEPWSLIGNYRKIPPASPWSNHPTVLPASDPEAQHPSPPHISPSTTRLYILFIYIWRTNITSERNSSLLDFLGVMYVYYLHVSCTYISRSFLIDRLMDSWILDIEGRFP
jgi:hypothetical protein